MGATDTPGAASPSGALGNDHLQSVVGFMLLILYFSV
jgi:hypothetical protein